MSQGTHLPVVDDVLIAAADVVLVVDDVAVAAVQLARAFLHVLQVVRVALALHAVNLGAGKNTALTPSIAFEITSSCLTFPNYEYVLCNYNTNAHISN